MQSFFWHILSDRRVYGRLQEEMKAAVADGTIPADGNISWTEAQNLHYFQACMKEAMRVRPAVGLNITRVVPPEGAELDGHSLPGGVSVAVNGWVLHRDRATFGEDADVYRPERWLDDVEEARRMERYMCQVSSRRFRRPTRPVTDDAVTDYSSAVALMSASAATWRCSRSTRSARDCCATIPSNLFTLVENWGPTPLSLLCRTVWRFTFRGISGKVYGGGVEASFCFLAGTVLL